MRRFSAMLAVVLSFLYFGPIATGQTSAPMPSLPSDQARIAQLGLSPPLGLQLETAMANKRYVDAEALLLASLKQPSSPTYTSRLLVFLGGVYLATGDTSQAAVAWKKADALAPLEPPVRFSLAMAYVRLHHEDWAHTELEKLVTSDPKNALYPYWLGRIAYDSHLYDDAVHRFQKALALDPGMARAHDNLGLCYFYLNQNAAAEAEFRRAIDLEPNPTPAAAWPHLNLAIELEFTNHLDEAVKELNRALQLNPTLPQADFELGNALERQSHLPEARAAFTRAMQLDPSYPEPHVALARLMRRAGDTTGATQQVELYKQLHAAQQRGTPATASAP